MPARDAHSLRTPVPTPFGIHIRSSSRNHTTYLWYFHRTWLLYRYLTSPNSRGFNGIYVTDVASQQGTSTLPDTCPVPLWFLRTIDALPTTLGTSGFCLSHNTPASAFDHHIHANSEGRTYIRFCPVVDPELKEWVCLKVRRAESTWANKLIKGVCETQMPPGATETKLAIFIK